MECIQAAMGQFGAGGWPEGPGSRTSDTVLALRESERRFREMMSRIKLISLMLDSSARIIYCNDYLLELSGWSRDEVTGRNWFELFIPPENRELNGVFENLLRDAEPAWHYENEILTRTGARRLIRWNNSVLRSAAGDVIGTASIGEDITEREEAEQKRHESDERFRQMAANIHQVFWITDSQLKQILYVSPAYERIWERSCESLYQHPLSFAEAVHQDDRERFLAGLERKKQGQPTELEFRIIPREGVVRWIRAKSFPVRDEGGNFYRTVGIAEDVTASKQLEEQLRQAQKMEAVGQLAGGVAHDFNNILAATMMQAELALMIDGVPQEVREGLEQIRAYSERAANLTRQLLLFSRRQVMQQQNLELNQAVTNLTKMLRRIIGEDVSLQLHLHSRPLITFADPGMLDQVVMNIAVNARDAMAGGGRLLIETSERTVDEEFARNNPDAQPGRYVCLRMSDTGTGIPPEVLPRIFEPFFTTKDVGKGTGLGLATVFGIVQQHHGWINVRSEVGRGTEFEIFLPAGTTGPQDSEDTVAERIRGGTETVLLVEDDFAVRALTRSTLERHGYSVLEAANGAEAIKHWEERKANIDLLLTDLVMPGGMNGHELANLLCGHDPKLRVLYTSGYSPEVVHRSLRGDNANCFLQKPGSPGRLLRMVRRLLDDRGAG